MDILFFPEFLFHSLCLIQISDLLEAQNGSNIFRLLHLITILGAHFSNGGERASGARLLIPKDLRTFPNYLDRLYAFSLLKKRNCQMSLVFQDRQSFNDFKYILINHHQALTPLDLPRFLLEIMYFVLVEFIVNPMLTVSFCR